MSKTSGLQNHSSWKFWRKNWQVWRSKDGLLDSGTGFQPPNRMWFHYFIPFPYIPIYSHNSFQSIFITFQDCEIISSISMSFGERFLIQSKWGHQTATSLWRLTDKEKRRFQDFSVLGKLQTLGETWETFAKICKTTKQDTDVKAQVFFTVSRCHGWGWTHWTRSAPSTDSDELHRCDGSSSFGLASLTEVGEVGSLQSLQTASLSSFVQVGLGSFVESYAVTQWHVVAYEQRSKPRLIGSCWII